MSFTRALSTRDELVDGGAALGGTSLLSLSLLVVSPGAISRHQVGAVESEQIDAHLRSNWFLHSKCHASVAQVDRLLRPAININVEPSHSPRINNERKLIRRGSRNGYPQVMDRE